MIEKLRLKFIYWMSLIVLGAMMVALGQLAVMLYYPFETVNVKEPIPITNIDNTVKRGDQLIIICNYVKYVNKDAALSFQLYNLDIKHYIALPSEMSNVIEGQGVAIKPVFIPKTVVVGNYKLFVTVKYEINSLRTICKRFSTVDFKVIP